MSSKYHNQFKHHIVLIPDAWVYRKWLVAQTGEGDMVRVISRRRFRHLCNHGVVMMHQGRDDYWYIINNWWNQPGFSYWY